MSKLKTGLVVEGGGMKCVYAAGVLDRFLDDAISFDEVIGVSAGSANAASFLAGQKNRNRRFYEVHSQDPRYIGLKNFFRTGNFFGLSYIYGDLSNSDGMDPLDYDAVMANPCEFYITATDAISGKAKYFTKEDMKRDHYEHVMASSALPVMCKPVKIGGRYYYDGGVSDSIPVAKAMHDGCERVVVILSKPRGYVMEPEKYKLIYTYWLHKYPNIIYRINHRHERYNRQMEEVLRLEEEGKVFLFPVPDDMDVGTYTKDPALLEKLYERGREDAAASSEHLKKFLAMTD